MHGVSGTEALTGFPAYYVLGDGDGGTDAQVEIDGAHVNQQELLAVIHVDLGEPLRELTGQEGATATEAFDPLADNETVEVGIAGGQLQMLGPGGETLFVQGFPTG